MAIVSGYEILKNAKKQKYAVGAFNITSINQMQAVIEAAVEKKSPLIIQTSVTPSKYMNPEIIAEVVRILCADLDIPVCLHLDHCTDPEYCMKCADVGYTSIMIDASKMSFEDNIRVTKEVTAYCHNMKGVSVEGELGTIGGVEDEIEVSEKDVELCTPDMSIEYISKTGIDLFAPAIGTAHGVYKVKNPVIDFKRFQDIEKKLEACGMDVPLVVHGGTGLSEEYVKRLIDLGGAKYNVSTELKHKKIDAVFEYISNHREEYDPVKIDKEERKVIKACIENWINLLGSAAKGV